MKINITHAFVHSKQGNGLTAETKITDDATGQEIDGATATVVIHGPLPEGFRILLDTGTGKPAAQAATPPAADSTIKK